MWDSYKDAWKKFSKLNKKQIKIDKFSSCRFLVHFGSFSHKQTNKSTINVVFYSYIDVCDS